VNLINNKYFIQEINKTFTNLSKMIIFLFIIGHFDRSIKMYHPKTNLHAFGILFNKFKYFSILELSILK
jgi:hypothetical protein